MSSLLWIAFGFVAGIVIFLMVAYFTRDTSTANQHKILRFLTSLCSGFAGGFFTGDALFKFEQQLSSGAKMGVSGTAGFALFFFVWLTYGGWSRPEPPPPPDRFRASIPEGLTFEQAVRVVVQAARGNVVFEGFQEKELKVKLRAVELDGRDAAEALTKLRYGAYEKLPDYKVNLAAGVFRIDRG
jgi:hypothetical protein